jgi:hypothetical protein
MTFKLVKLIDPIQLVSVSGSLAYKGEYDSDTTYAVGDAVSYNDSSYIMHTLAAAGTAPTDTAH